MRYLVMIRGTKSGYSADVPDLPGCVAAAKSIEKTRALIAEAIGLHLDLMRESGEKIRKPSKRLTFTIDETSEEEEFCTWVEVKQPETVSS